MYVILHHFRRETAVNASNKSDPKPNRLANNAKVLRPQLLRRSKNGRYDHTLYAIQQLGSPKCFMRLFAEMLRAGFVLFICPGQFPSVFCGIGLRRWH